jgi:hypothetical protein
MDECILLEIDPQLNHLYDCVKKLFEKIEILDKNINELKEISNGKKT